MIIITNIIYLACFRHKVKWSTTAMNETWPKSPMFFVLVFALLLLSCHILFCMNCTVFLVQLLEQVIYLFILQSACNGELEEAWIVNKSINCFFASLVVESSQKSLMIFKMLPSLKALSLWGPWHKVSITLINGGSFPEKVLI